MQQTAREIYYDHFAQQLLERYGIELTDELYDEMLEQVTSDGPTYVIDGSVTTRAIHCVSVDGQDVYVLYRREKNAFITALPPTFYYEGFRRYHQILHGQKRRKANEANLAGGLLDHT